MRISRDKSNKIAKAAFEAIKEVEDIEFIEDPQTIRQEIRAILERLLTEEEAIDKAEKDSAAGKR